MKTITENQARKELRKNINLNFSGYSEEEINNNMFFTIDDVIEFMKEFKLKE